MYILGYDMYILGYDMYILGYDMYILGYHFQWNMISLDIISNQICYAMLIFGL